VSSHETPEQRVRELTARIEALEQELTSLSHAVSHDLRAPLRAIDGFSQMLIEDHAASLNEEGRHLLDVVRENTRIMGTLIDGLLSYSRLNRSEMHCSAIDMTDLARACFGELLSPQEQAGIDFTLGPLPACQGDPSMLKQVWMSLLSNAVKFSSGRDRPALEIGGRQEEGENIYFVRDNGVGFDMEYAGKLFKIFQRLHSPREFAGTGTGLASVQRIVQRHGGRVRAEGAVDAGATFTFTLPIRGVEP
jgi:light-regulated signal transduction histidine kinase (bacteriophytochrome)